MGIGGELLSGRLCFVSAVAVMRLFPQADKLAYEAVVALPVSPPLIQSGFGSLAYGNRGSEIGDTHEYYLSVSCRTGLPGLHRELPILYLSQ